MKIGVFAPYRDDHERNIAFCQHAGVGYVGLHARSAPSAAELQKLRTKYAEGGIDFSVLIPSRITTEALIDERLRTSEIETLRRTIASMGEAGVKILHLYVSSVHAPSSGEEREVFMRRLIEYYGRIVEQAEESQVKIATHTYNSPSKLIWNYDTMNRILEAVPSECNGVLFCTGKTQLAGDDMDETIRKYGSRVFLVHVRNVGGKYEPGAYETLDQQRLEVRFDVGDVDMVGVFKTLSEIGFSGPVFPEHFPPIGGDHIAGLAWTIGYLRALEAALGV